MVDTAAAAVEQFRDAALGLTDWTAALKSIGRATNAHMIHVTGVTNGQLLISLTDGISADLMDAYFQARAHDPAINPRTAGIMSFAQFRSFTDDDLLGDRDRSGYRIYDDLFRRADATHSAQIRMGSSQSVELGLTCMRSRTAHAYHRPTLDLINGVAPGIASALHAALVLGTTQETMMVRTAETLNGVVFLLGHDRAIVSLSASAEALIREARTLTVRSGRLVAVDGVDEQALERAFRLAYLDDPLETKQSRVRLRAAGSLIVVDLCPLPRRLGGPLSRARVLLTTEPRSRPKDFALPALCEAYGLTIAEGTVTAMLASGCTVREIAEKRNSALTTVRTQLKTVFEKTGTHRQTELIMLLRDSG